MNPMDLSGKQILITGASSGIGRQTAITCSQLGASVALIARREDKLQETVSMLEGKGHIYYVYDLSDVEGIEALVRKMYDERGVIHGFVHCAGVSTPRAIRQMKYEVMQTAMNINYYSFVEIVRCLSAKKRFADGGSIVAISSIASIQGSRANTIYCASKAAIDATIRCMATELGGKGIRVNSVRPGWVATDMYEQYLEQNVDKQGAADWVRSKRLLPITEPYEVANTIAFLLSDATKTITGTAIHIEGGVMQV